MRKFGRKKDHREQMLKNLATSIIIYERVETTSPKAKEISSSVDKMINIAKKGTLESRRQLLRFFNHENAVKKIYYVLIDRFKDKNSGYTKIYNCGYRVGDGAKKAIIMLIGAKTTAVVEKNDIKDISKDKTAINKKTLNNSAKHDNSSDKNRTKND